MTPLERWIPVPAYKFHGCFLLHTFICWDVILVVSLPCYIPNNIMKGILFGRGGGGCCCLLVHPAWCLVQTRHRLRGEVDPRGAPQPRPGHRPAGQMALPGWLEAHRPSRWVLAGFRFLGGWGGGEETWTVGSLVSSNNSKEEGS
jgi:hypothetical protein